MKNFLKLGILIIYICSNINGQNNLTEQDMLVLKEPCDNMMKSYLTNIIDGQFAVRDSLLATLKTRSDWDKWSQTIRDSMMSWTGPLPGRTALNARITGRLERKDYIVEKILFESRPDYYVSANLYLPKNIAGPLPAHLNVIGHAQIGKADERYQRMSVAQVKNGFVVLTIDQLGQGERGMLSSHRIIGTQAFLSGTHLFNYMVWDVIRAIDYLTSRPEVDASKIGMTGSSGGGMMTTYILPFEDRVSIAVPVCNPNTWSYRVHADLATDHEQVFFGAFEGGIDPRGDPLFTHVPKPLLLNTTTDDPLNPPVGVWDLNTWLYKCYSAHGSPEKLSTTMVKAGHDYNREQREITYSWMLRWTGNNITDFFEKEGLLEREEDLWATSGGSVYNEPESIETHKLVLDYLNEHKAEIKVLRTVDEISNHKIEMAGLIETVLNTNFNEVSAKYYQQGNKISEEIKITSYIIEPEPGIVLPGVLMEQGTGRGNNDVILYLHEEGKSAILKDISLVKKILSRGYRIFAVDLRGIGETYPDMSGKFWDFLAGKPIFGQRIRDVLTIVEWLKGEDMNAAEIKLWGTGMGALYGAFSGIFTEDISGFLLERSLLSFESIVQVRNPGYNQEILLPGILKKFDMPQIYQALSPRPVSVINPLLGDKTPASEKDYKVIDQPVANTYVVLSNKDAWRITHMNDEEREEYLLSLFN